MENGLLDRVEGNANVHRWSEQTQLEKGNSIAVGYMSELPDCTRISVMQNNLQQLKEIWDQWGKKTKQLFYDNYGDLPYLLDVPEPLLSFGTRRTVVSLLGKQIWYLPWRSTLPSFVVPGFRVIGSILELLASLPFGRN